ncbi:hypothetical protein FDECE_11097 [Fusarium decemcellulare]|nr:hypothetical protein FDECE_11097 [Fusarium decemcellulare]
MAPQQDTKSPLQTLPDEVLFRIIRFGGPLSAHELARTSLHFWGKLRGHWIFSLIALSPRIESLHTFQKALELLGKCSGIHLDLGLLVLATHIPSIYLLHDKDKTEDKGAMHEARDDLLSVAKKEFALRKGSEILDLIISAYRSTGLVGDFHERAVDANVISVHDALHIFKFLDGDERPLEPIDLQCFREELAEKFCEVARLVESLDKLKVDQFVTAVIQLLREEYKESWTQPNIAKHIRNSGRSFEDASRDQQLLNGYIAARHFLGRMDDAETLFTHALDHQFGMRRWRRAQHSLKTYIAFIQGSFSDDPEDSTRFDPTSSKQKPVISLWEGGKRLHVEEGLSIKEHWEKTTRLCIRRGLSQFQKRGTRQDPLS